MNDAFENPPVRTPGALHNFICDVIDEAISKHAEEIEVAGIVSNLIDNRNDSGWMFFFLGDEKNSVRCVVAPDTSSKLRFDLKKGGHIRVRGKFWLYRKDASVELFVNSIEPVKSLADKIQDNEIIERFKEEGLLRKAQLKSLPTDPPPSRFAIIAPPNSNSPMDLRSGAAGAGGLSLLVRYMEDYTPTALISEIERCNSHKKDIDGIVVINSGREDMNLYDNEEVLRAAIESDLPVICAVGSSSDHCLLDFVAVESIPNPFLAGQWLRDIQQTYRKSRKTARKQLLTFSFIALFIVIVLIILWGIGVFGG